MSEPVSRNYLSLGKSLHLTGLEKLDEGSANESTYKNVAKAILSVQEGVTDAEIIQLIEGQVTYTTDDSCTRKVADLAEQAIGQLPVDLVPDKADAPKATGWRDLHYELRKSKPARVPLFGFFFKITLAPIITTGKYLCRQRSVAAAEKDVKRMISAGSGCTDMNSVRDLLILQRNMLKKITPPDTELVEKIDQTLQNLEEIKKAREGGSLEECCKNLLKREDSELIIPTGVHGPNGFQPVFYIFTNTELHRFTVGEPDAKWNLEGKREEEKQTLLRVLLEHQGSRSKVEPAKEKKHELFRTMAANVASEQKLTENRDGLEEDSPLRVLDNEIKALGLTKEETPGPQSKDVWDQCFHLMVGEKDSPGLKQKRNIYSLDQIGQHLELIKAASKKSSKEDQKIVLDELNRRIDLLEHRLLEQFPDGLPPILTKRLADMRADADQQVNKLLPQVSKTGASLRRAAVDSTLISDAEALRNGKKSDSDIVVLHSAKLHKLSEEVKHNNHVEALASYGEVGAIIDALVGELRFAEAARLAEALQNTLPVPDLSPGGEGFWSKVAKDSDWEALGSWEKQIAQVAKCQWESFIRLGETRMSPRQLIGVVNSRAVLVRLMNAKGAWVRNQAQQRLPEGIDIVNPGKGPTEFKKNQDLIKELSAKGFTPDQILTLAFEQTNTDVAQLQDLLTLTPYSPTGATRECQERYHQLMAFLENGRNQTQCRFDAMQTGCTMEAQVGSRFCETDEEFLNSVADIRGLLGDAAKSEHPEDLLPESLGGLRLHTAMTQMMVRPEFSRALHFGSNQLKAGYGALQWWQKIQADARRDADGDLSLVGKLAAEKAYQQLSENSSPAKMRGRLQLSTEKHLTGVQGLVLSSTESQVRQYYLPFGLGLEAELEAQFSTHPNDATGAGNVSFDIESWVGSMCGKKDGLMIASKFDGGRLNIRSNLKTIQDRLAITEPGLLSQMAESEHELLLMDEYLMKTLSVARGRDAQYESVSAAATEALILILNRPSLLANAAVRQRMDLIFCSHYRVKGLLEESLTSGEDYSHNLTELGDCLRKKIQDQLKVGNHQSAAALMQIGERLYSSLSVEIELKNPKLNQEKCEEVQKLIPRFNTKYQVGEKMKTGKEHLLDRVVAVDESNEELANFITYTAMIHEQVEYSSPEKVRAWLASCSDDEIKRLLRYSIQLKGFSPDLCPAFIKESLQQWVSGSLLPELSKKLVSEPGLCGRIFPKSGEGEWKRDSRNPLKFKRGLKEELDLETLSIRSEQKVESFANSKCLVPDSIRAAIPHLSDYIPSDSPVTKVVGPPLVYRHGTFEILVSHQLAVPVLYRLDSGQRRILLQSKVGATGVPGLLAGRGIWVQTKNQKEGSIDVKALKLPFNEITVALDSKGAVASLKVDGQLAREFPKDLGYPPFSFLDPAASLYIPASKGKPEQVVSLDKGMVLERTGEQWVVTHGPCKGYTMTSPEDGVAKALQEDLGPNMGAVFKKEGSGDAKILLWPHGLERRSGGRVARNFSDDFKSDVTPLLAEITVSKDDQITGSPSSLLYLAYGLMQRGHYNKAQAILDLARKGTLQGDEQKVLFSHVASLLRSMNPQTTRSLLFQLKSELQLMDMEKQQLSMSVFSPKVEYEYKIKRARISALYGKYLQKKAESKSKVGRSLNPKEEAQLKRFRQEALAELILKGQKENVEKPCALRSLREEDITAETLSYLATYLDLDSDNVTTDELKNPTRYDAQFILSNFTHYYENIASRALKKEDLACLFRPIPGAGDESLSKKEQEMIRAADCMRRILLQLAVNLPEKRSPPNLDEQLAANTEPLEDTLLEEDYNVDLVLKRFGDLFARAGSTPGDFPPNDPCDINKRKHMDSVNAVSAGHRILKNFNLLHRVDHAGQGAPEIRSVSATSLAELAKALPETIDADKLTDLMDPHNHHATYVLKHFPAYLEAIGKGLIEIHELQFLQEPFEVLRGNSMTPEEKAQQYQAIYAQRLLSKLALYTAAIKPFNTQEMRQLRKRIPKRHRDKTGAMNLLKIGLKNRLKLSKVTLADEITHDSTRLFLEEIMTPLSGSLKESQKYDFLTPEGGKTTGEIKAASPLQAGEFEVDQVLSQMKELEQDLALSSMEVEIMTKILTAMQERGETTATVEQLSGALSLFQGISFTEIRREQSLALGNAELEQELLNPSNVPEASWKASEVKNENLTKLATAFDIEELFDLAPVEEMPEFSADFTAGADDLATSAELEQIRLGKEQVGQGRLQEEARYNRTLKKEKIEGLITSLERELNPDVEDSAARNLQNSENKIRDIIKNGDLACVTEFKKENPYHCERDLIEALLDAYQSGAVEVEDHEAAVTEYLLCATAVQQLSKGLVECQKFSEISKCLDGQANAQLKSELAKRSRSLCEILGRNLNTKRYQENGVLLEPRLNRKFLVAEYRLPPPPDAPGIILREGQRDLVINIDENPESWSSLRMGEGKTSFIMPTVAALLVEKGQLPVLLVPPQLQSLNQLEFDVTTQHAYGKRAEPLTIDLDSTNSAAYLAGVYNGILKTREKKGYLVTTVPTLASLRSLSVQLREQHQSLSDRVCQEAKKKDVSVQEFFRSDDEGAALFYQQYDIGRRLHWVRKIERVLDGKIDVLSNGKPSQQDLPTIFFADEADSLFDISTEVNRGRGNKEVVSPEKREVCSQVFHSILCADLDSAELKGDERQNLEALRSALMNGSQVTLTEKPTKDYLLPVAKLLLQDPEFLGKLPCGDESKRNLEMIAGFLIGENLELDVKSCQWNSELSPDSSAYKAQVRLSALRHILSTTLPCLLSADSGQAFALDEESGCLSVPAVSGNKTAGNGFGDEYELIAFQYLAHIQSARTCSKAGPATHDFYVRALRILQERNPEAYQKLLTKYKESYPDADPCSIKSVAEAIIANPAFHEESTRIVDQVLFETGLVTRYSSQFTVSSQSVVSGRKVGGVTGTLQPYCLPGFDPEKQSKKSTRQVEAETFMKMAKMHQKGFEETVKTLDDLDQVALSENFKEMLTDQETTAIVNEGGFGLEGKGIGQWVAELRGVVDSPPNIVWFDQVRTVDASGKAGTVTKMYLWEEGEENPRELKDKRELSKLSKRFVGIYGPQFTRGADLPLGPGKVHYLAARATDAQAMGQAVWRGRGTGREHTSVVWVPKSVKGEDEWTIGRTIKWAIDRGLANQLPKNLVAQRFKVRELPRVRIREFFNSSSAEELADGYYGMNEDQVAQRYGIGRFQDGLHQLFADYFITDKSAHFEEELSPTESVLTTRSLETTYKREINTLKEKRGKLGALARQTFEDLLSEAKESEESLSKEGIASLFYEPTVGEKKGIRTWAFGQSQAKPSLAAALTRVADPATDPRTKDLWAVYLDKDATQKQRDLVVSKLVLQEVLGMAFEEYADVNVELPPQERFEKACKIAESNLEKRLGEDGKRAYGKLWVTAGAALQSASEAIGSAAYSLFSAIGLSERAPVPEPEALVADEEASGFLGKIPASQRAGLRRLAEAAEAMQAAEKDLSDQLELFKKNHETHEKFLPRETSSRESANGMQEQVLEQQEELQQQQVVTSGKTVDPRFVERTEPRTYVEWELNHERADNSTSSSLSDWGVDTAFISPEASAVLRALPTLSGDPWCKFAIDQNGDVTLISKQDHYREGIISRRHRIFAPIGEDVKQIHGEKSELSESESRSIAVLKLRAGFSQFTDKEKELLQAWNKGLSSDQRSNFHDWSTDTGVKLPSAASGSR